MMNGWFRHTEQQIKMKCAIRMIMIQSWSCIEFSFSPTYRNDIKHAIYSLHIGSEIERCLQHARVCFLARYIIRYLHMWDLLQVHDRITQRGFNVIWSTRFSNGKKLMLIYLSSTIQTILLLSITFQTFGK